jgi:predicted nuclease of predicted toxin-antitoxin system
MRFLLDANMPRSAAGAVQRLGHEAVDVREIGLGGAEDKRIAAYAKEHRLA